MIEVTCAIIQCEGKILITQRSEDMPHPLQWEFPGGKLKPGESPVRCIVREIKEELGVTVEVDGLLPSVTHDYGDQSIRLIPFICSMGEEQIFLHQHKANRWIKREELVDYDVLEADLKIIDRLKDLP